MYSVLRGGAMCSKAKTKHERSKHMTFKQWLDVNYKITRPDDIYEEKREEYEDKYEDDCLVYDWTPTY